MLFDAAGRPVASHAIALKQYLSGNGWVEHDAEEIWQASLACCRTVKGHRRADIAAIGITNQRETTADLGPQDGQPLHHAIVWQDRRTAARCRALQAEGWEGKIARKTGLLLDPYFSATKLEWLLDN